MRGPRSRLALSEGEHEAFTRKQAAFYGDRFRGGTFDQVITTYVSP